MYLKLIVLGRTGQPGQHVVSLVGQERKSEAEEYQFTKNMVEQLAAATALKHLN